LRKFVSISGSLVQEKIAIGECATALEQSFRRTTFAWDTHVPTGQAWEIYRLLKVQKKQVSS
jgi:hypothetical protein